MDLHTGQRVRHARHGPGTVRLLPGGSGLYMVEFTQFDSFLARWLWVPRGMIEGIGD